MKEAVDKCSTKGCSVDIGTVIDNEDCTSKRSWRFATQEEAIAWLEKLRELAIAASPEAKTASSITLLADGSTELAIEFEFSCQAEMIIFELSLRSLPPAAAESHR